MDVCTACNGEHDPGLPCDPLADPETNPVRWALDVPPIDPRGPGRAEEALEGILDDELGRERVILSSLVRSIVLRVLRRSVRAFSTRVDGDTPDCGTRVRPTD